MESAMKPLYPGTTILAGAGRAYAHVFKQKTAVHLSLLLALVKRTLTNADIGPFDCW